MVTLIEKVYRLHLRNLKYKNLRRKKILICFAGIPGSGKSTIAKILEEKYKGIRIENNWARKHFIATKGGDSDLYPEKVDNFVKEYLDYFLKNYTFVNKLFILDSGIERKYGRISQFAKEKGFKMFVINLKISKKTATERAFARKGGVDRWFVKNINRWIKENEEFNKKHKVDVVLDSEKKSDLTKVFERLDNLVR